MSLFFSQILLQTCCFMSSLLRSRLCKQHLLALYMGLDLKAWILFMITIIKDRTGRGLRNIFGQLTFLTGEETCCQSFKDSFKLTIACLVVEIWFRPAHDILLMTLSCLNQKSKFVQWSTCEAFINEKSMLTTVEKVIRSH